MLVLKIVMLFAVFGTISTIGVKISNRYTERANNLKQIKKALNIFETKIMYTYEPICKQKYVFRFCRRCVGEKFK